MQTATPPVPTVSRQRAVIVEDDRHAAAWMQGLLNLYCPEAEVVGMAHDAESAQALLRRTDFDIAFLDVELGGSGDTCFRVLEELGQPAFKIVIVSAYERYALPAIKISAVDYLVKPVVPGELAACWRKLTASGSSSQQQQQRMPTGPAIRKMILRQGDQVYIKAVTEILFLKASGFYTQVHFHHLGGLRSVTLSKPLNELELEWQCRELVRVHKSFMVNTSFVRQIRKSGNGLRLQLETGVEIPVARRRTASFMSQYGT